MKSNFLSKASFATIMLGGTLSLFSNSASSQNNCIDVSINTKEIEVNLCQPYYIVINVKNKCDSILTINTPSIYKENLKLDLVLNGKSMPKPKWSMSDISNKTKLNPYDSIVVRFELNRFFPILLESGTYILSAEYFPDTINSNEANKNYCNVYIKPLSTFDSKSIDDYRKFLRASIEGKIIRGKDFLKNHPLSCFAKIVSKELAFALKVSNKYDDAIFYYNASLSDKYKIADWEKEELLNDLAWTYYFKGDFEAAIKTMNLVPDSPNKFKYIEGWVKELNDKK